MDLGDGTVVAGVTSGGLNSSCQTPDESWDTDVFGQRGWIQNQTGGDLSNSRCGTLAQAGTSGAVIHFGEGNLSSSNSQEFWSIEIPSDIGVIRFVLNGEDGVGNDFDLYLKRESLPSTTDFECRSIRQGTYEVCEIVAPDAGTWFVLVDYFTGGGGNYQIVSTPFRDETVSRLYAVGNDLGDGSSALYEIRNPGSHPTADLVGESGVTLLDVGVDPTTGRIYGVSGGNFYELDFSTGVAGPVGPTGRSDLNSLEFDLSGQAYSWGSFGGFYRLDKTTGGTLFVGNVGYSSGGDLAFDAEGALYGTTESQLVRIDSTTGVGTLVGSLGFSGAFGLDIDADGTTMFVGRGSNFSDLAEIYLVDKETAETALIGSVGNLAPGLFGLSFREGPIGALIFQDGFESGDTSAWSATVGQ